MNQNFSNFYNKEKMIVDDEGVTIYHSVEEEDDSKWFFPYGSIKSIDVKWGSVTFKSEELNVCYTFDDGDRKKFKKIHDEISNLNWKAEKSEAEFTTTIKPLVLTKDFDSFKRYFKGLFKKHEEEWDGAIKSIISSMNEDEEILEGFHTWILEMNGGRESVVSCMSVITNRRFYYAGGDGKKAMFWMKTGAIELKDVHALTVGAGTFTAPSYIKFEVKNDDYKVSTFADTTELKKKFEEGIKACESDKAATIIQSALSPADEIKKFKELLDADIITQEEFDEKKKQLLGL